MNRRLVFIFFVLLIFGFLYRLYLGSLAESKLIWDMSEYSGMAREIVDKGITANCCTHGAGYPLFLAIIYKLFGVENLFAVRVIQSLLDTVVSIFVFLIAKKIFNDKTAFIAFILYILNPFTSAYTGLILAETVSIIIVALIAFFLAIRDLSKKKVLIFILGFLIGFLAITKISFYFFTIVLLISLLLLLGKTWRNKITLFFLLIFGYLVSTLYSIYSNYAVYKKISIMPPYRTMGTLLYGSFFINYYPELTVEFDRLDPQYARLTEEYYFRYMKDPASQPDYEAKYIKLFWNQFLKEPLVFFGNTLRNMFLIWDKRFLYTYYDPFYPADSWVLRGLMFSIFFLFLAGFISYIKKHIRDRLFRPLILFTILIFFYISFVLSIVSNESRLSLVFFPFFILWASNGVYFVYKKIGNFYGRNQST